MYNDCEEFGVGDSTEKYYNVHGHYFETFEDGMGNTYVNVEDVRKSGFGIYRREDFNISLEAKRSIILEDFYQFLLAQATNYIIKNKETGSFLREENILNTIEKCRAKLLGESGQTSQKLNQDTRRSNPNFQVTSRDFLGGQDGRNDRETSSKLLYEPPPSMRPPRILPNNFVPTHTQRNTGSVHRTSRNTNAHFNNQRRRQNNQQRSNFRNDEIWDQGPREQRQHNNRDNKRQDLNNRNNLDDVSQSSDTSDKKMTFLKSLEEIEPMTKIELSVGKEYVLKVSQLEQEKSNVCWAQESKSVEQLEDLLLDILDEAENLRVIENPKRGQLALAEYEEVWCRCRVTKNNPLNVIFIDYGNKSEVSEVKALPVKFKKVPALANRFVIHNNTISLKEEMQLSVTIKRKYEDDTYLIEAIEKPKSDAGKVNIPSKSQSVKEIEQSELNPVKESKRTATEEQPITKPVVETDIKKEPKNVEKLKTEKIYTTMPTPMTKLKNGDKVMLVGLIGNRMAVKTKESTMKSKEIVEYIKSLDKSSLVLSHVTEDQLVLCSKDGIPNLCRGVVIKKDSPTIVTVKYLDFPGEEKLSVKSLRNVDDYLAGEPLTLIFSPELEVIEKLNDKSIDYIESLVENKEKMFVVLTEDNDFDLKLANGELLTQKLFELEKEENNMNLVPKTSTSEATKNVSVKKEVNNTSIAKEDMSLQSSVANPNQKTIMFNDMDSIKPTVGSTDKYICYTIQDMSELTLISLKQESILYTEQISDLVVEDTTPYEPIVMEMCLVAHKLPEEEDASWYRAVVIDIDEGSYNISMVDFGTSVMAKKEDIRKFPEYLKDIPMLGIFCELVNIPHEQKVLKKIKELVPESSEVEVHIVALNDIVYSIELPKVYNELKKLNLC